MSHRSLAFLFVALLSSFGLSVLADVRLPAIFSDHMVIQQQQDIKVWGWAEPGESITVSIGQSTKTTTAAPDGKWSVTLPPMMASKTPATLTVKGSTTIEIKDVLVGEVWLCSGQSNMEWPVPACTDAQKEIEAAKFPNIRHIKVPLVPSTTPLDNFQSSWQVCSPGTAGGFTACGFFTPDVGSAPSL